MITEEQKDNIMMEVEERLAKDKKDVIFFIFAEVFIEFVLIILVANRADMLAGFVIANIVMVLYLIQVMSEIKKNPYRAVEACIDNELYRMDMAYLASIKEETRMTKHMKVVHTGKFIGCVYGAAEKMDVITNFNLNYLDIHEQKESGVFVIRFSGVKDYREGYNKEFSIIYLSSK